MLVRGENISVGYRSGKNVEVIQEHISVELAEGELITLIGPNGSGKSTLLRVLAGIDKPLAGEVYIDSKKLSEISAHERSRLIALVLTDRVNNNFLRVEDLVGLGRYPYSGWTGRLSKEDLDKIEEAVSLCGLESLRHKTLDQLSDGERQRAMIAKAIAQDTALVILDEPTAHLDLKTRVEVLLLLRDLARKTRKVIVVATHELELAITLADEVWLMAKRNSFITAIPEELVMNGALSAAFNSHQIRFDDEAGSFRVSNKTNRSINLQGSGFRSEWTRRALLRKGIGTDESSRHILKVTDDHWELDDKVYHNLRELLAAVFSGSY